MRLSETQGDRLKFIFNLKKDFTLDFLTNYTYVHVLNVGLECQQTSYCLMAFSLDLGLCCSSTFEISTIASGSGMSTG